MQLRRVRRGEVEGGEEEVALLPCRYPALVAAVKGPLERGTRVVPSLAHAVAAGRKAGSNHSTGRGKSAAAGEAMALL
jgi:hypothetical protein